MSTIRTQREASTCTCTCYCCCLTITTWPIFTSFPSPVWCRCLVSPEAPSGHSSSPLAPPAAQPERCALSPAWLARGGWSGTRGSCPWRCDSLPQMESPMLSIQQVMTAVAEEVWGACTLFEDDSFSDLLPINIRLSPDQRFQSDLHCRGKTNTQLYQGRDRERVTFRWRNAHKVSKMTHKILICIELASIRSSLNNAQLKIMEVVCLTNKRHRTLSPIFLLTGCLMSSNSCNFQEKHTHFVSENNTTPSWKHGSHT